MSTGDTIKQLWGKYDPEHDKDQREFRANQQATNLFVAQSLTDGAIIMKEIDGRVKKIETKVGNAEIGAKAGWSVTKYIAVFIGEAIALAPILYAAIRLALK